MVEEEWAFRFPRREIAIPGVERELVVLPRLAPLLSVPIPVPRFVGRASERFPWPFFGAPLLPGREPADAALTDDERADFGAQLGRVLRTVHAQEVRVVVDPDAVLPVDFNRRADMVVRVSLARENLAQLRVLELWRAPALVERILASAEELPQATGDLALTHGDLHQRHVLVADGAIAAIIDWGDVCLADPCIDLALVWSLLTPPGRERFFAHYGAVTEEQRLRSRVLAIGLDSMLARYAHDVRHTSLQRECLAGLERTLVE